MEKWAAAMAPAMIALQVGSIIGHLARRTLGQYELPLPRVPSDEIVVVPSNVAAFASDWSLEFDDVTMWCAAHDLAAHAVLSRPHVRARLQSLLVAHASSFRPDLGALEQRLRRGGTRRPRRTRGPRTPPRRSRGARRAGRHARTPAGPRRAAPR